MRTAYMAHRDRPSIERLRSVLEERDGVLYWKAKTHPRANRIKVGEVAGVVSVKGYVVVRVDYIDVFAHHVVWALRFGEYPSTSLDHINRIKTDNRIENLREATASDNAANCESKGRTSKYVGVSLDRGRGTWIAQIMKGGRNQYIGRYQSEEDAALAYNRAATKIHGEFAALNQIP